MTKEINMEIYNAPECFVVQIQGGQNLLNASFNINDWEKDEDSYDF